MNQSEYQQKILKTLNYQKNGKNGLLLVIFLYQGFLLTFNYFQQGSTKCRNLSTIELHYKLFQAQAE